MRDSIPPRPRLELLEAYRTVRRASEALASPLSPEDACIQSMPDASPAKWHLAHTSWFFETFVLSRRRAHEPFDPHFAHLFNSYYQSVGTMHARPQRGLLSRPALERVHAYRRHVDVAMAALLEGPVEEELAALVELGLHHEQQHQELLLTDIKHALSCNPMWPAYQVPTPDANAPAPLDSGARREARWFEYEGGLASLGHEGEGFHFDNEGPRHRVYLEPFALAPYLVTAGEYVAFIEDGGYARPELWLSEGWDTVQREAWQAPAYWRRSDAVPRGAWEHFTLHGPRPVDLDAPVCHVSFYEADAFARWAGARLPTEAEWEHAASGAPLSGNFASSGALHPVPAATGAEAHPGQLYGDVWEWTGSAYAPYPGYRPPPGAVGEYNGKFMCSQMVLRGGSCATPPGHVRPTYRNFFHPDRRWQFTGLRLARDL